MTEPAPGKSTRPVRGRVLRRRSLLWMVPERTARRLSWVVVVLLCITSAALLVAVLRPRPVERHEGALTEALSAHLAMPVTVASARLEDSGQYIFGDISIGDQGDVLRAASGVYAPPREDTPGRLGLRGGVLTLDLDAWMSGRTHPTVFMLDAARRKTGLWRITLTDFTVGCRLGTSGTVTLERASAMARLTDDGNLHAEIDGTKLTITFDAGDDDQRLTLTGPSLPWAGGLLAPAIGDDVAGLLEPPSGTLTLITGAADAPGQRYNWKADLKSTLPLERLPAALGLGKLSGRTAVAVQAVGRRRRSATCYAEITLPENASASVTTSSLRNLRYLLTGEWSTPSVDDAHHTVRAVSLSLFITPRTIIIDAADVDQPAGLFTREGTNLLPILPDRIPLIDFKDRLNTLKRLWREAHTS